MDGIKGIDTNMLSLQLKSLMVFEFLNEYNELEQTIRKVFEKSLPDLPQEVLQQLYFYYGGKIGTYIEYESQSLKINSINFKDQEHFKELSINQIVKIFKSNNSLKAFNFNVESIQRSTTEYSFYDCVIRLLNMRNMLAHEVVDLKFKDKDLIELLSYEQISHEAFEILQNFDVHKMDNMTLYIASNIIFIRKLIAKLTIECS